MEIARYSFMLEINNELAGVLDEFILLYYTRRDGKDEIEINDPKHKRKFLSRTHLPGLKLKDILVGGKITLFGRQYRIRAFGDAFTERELGKSKMPCMALLLNVDAIGELWANVERMADSRVLNAKMVYLSPEDAAVVSSGIDIAPLRPGAPVVALELQGEEPQAKMEKLRGHLVDRGVMREGELALAYPEHVQRLKEAFFAVDPSMRLNSVRAPSVRMEDCTVVMVLPTAMAKGHGGEVLSDLMKALAAGGIALGGRAPKPLPGETRSTAPPPPPPGKPGEFGSPLMMTALTVVDMDRKCADELLEVYKLVVPDFGEMANEYSAGPAIALEVCGEDAVKRVREICGPRDVDVGKRIRPFSLRAKHGLSNAQPALHCTDLPEDGPLESEYLFVLLNQ